MQRLLALVTALALLVALPAAASAGEGRPGSPITRSASPATAWRPTSGGGFVFFGANVSDEFGPDGFVDFWSSQRADRRTRRCSATSTQPADVTWDGSVLAGSIPHARTATATRPARRRSPRPSTPSGDPFPFDDEFRDGNHQHRFNGVTPADGPERHARRRWLDLLARRRASPTRRRSRVFETNPTLVRPATSRTAASAATCSNAAGDTGLPVREPRGGRRLHRRRSPSPADGSTEHRRASASGDPDRRRPRRDRSRPSTPRPASPVAGGAIDPPRDRRLRRAVRATIAQERDLPRVRARGVTLDIEGTLDRSATMVVRSGRRASASDGTDQGASTRSRAVRSPAARSRRTTCRAAPKLLTVGSRRRRSRPRARRPTREAPVRVPDLRGRRRASSRSRSGTPSGTGSSAPADP